jgi:hypothetical protein
VFPLTASVTHLQPTIGSLFANNEAISEMISGLPLRQLAFDELITSNENNLPAITQDTMKDRDVFQDDDNHINSQLEPPPITVHDSTVENNNGSKVGVETKSAPLKKQKK